MFFRGKVLPGTKFCAFKKNARFGINPHKKIEIFHISTSVILNKTLDILYFQAALNGSTDVLHWLLEHNADAECKDRKSVIKQTF